MLMRHTKHQVAGEYAWYSAQAQCRTRFYTLWQREGEGGATSPQTPGAPQTAVSVDHGVPYPFSFAVFSLDASSFRFNKPFSLPNCSAPPLDFYPGRTKDPCPGNRKRAWSPR